VTSRKPGLGRGLESLIPTNGDPTSALSNRQTASDDGEANAMFSLINPDGSVNDRLPVTLDQMRALYADMVEARTYDDKSIAMQKQGRLATYAPFRGQEGAQIGAAWGLKAGDWVAGTYRDAALNWKAGYPWRLLILGRTGDERGGDVPEGVNVMPPSITVGGHMIHAVGLAWAEKMKGSRRIALTSFGDGATSEGDFHEAMNFAAVYDTPCVFLCQNNGYAISHPTARQMATETVAEKAEAYGIPGVRVDGNDVVAVYAAVTEAAESARTGKGPSFIEAVTYRLGPHTTADDPNRYRTESEVRAWEERDPLVRVRLLLEKAGAWDSSWQASLESEASARVEEAVVWAEQVPEPTSAEMFDRMFETPTPPLAEQAREAGDG
jgi:pyruvate dehydrogenase E1 component alpha subunit